MKPGKLTPRARKDIAQAINAMMSARENWTGAIQLQLPEEQQKQRRQQFNERRHELDALLDKHSEP